MKRLGRRAVPLRLRQLIYASFLVILCSFRAGAQVMSPCSECTCAGDRDGDGTVTVDEAVEVVGNVLNGCPPELRWYLGCGPRITGDQICPSAVVFCATEVVGEICGDPEASCCLAGSRCTGDRCNDPVVCTDKDPRNPPEGQCRLRSRRHYKRDIEYLAQTDLERLRTKLLGMNLTRFRYKGEPSSTSPHLGFIIEDVEPSPSVDIQGDAVDLYGYISMAVATIQVQEGEIQALRREIKALRERIDGPDEAAPLPKP